MGESQNPCDRKCFSEETEKKKENGRITEHLELERKALKNRDWVCAVSLAMCLGGIGSHSGGQKQTPIIEKYLINDMVER